jgi:hypothetical protein
MINIFIKKNQIYTNPIEYILKVLSKNKSIKIIFIDDKNGSDLIFDHTDSNSILINTEFYDKLINMKLYDFESYFKIAPIIFFPNSNKKDWLSTAFYMINSFQEYNCESYKQDKFERFKFEYSYQKKFGCIETNLVQICFDNFVGEYITNINLKNKERVSKMFLSHDIDLIHGSFFQDGLWALKKGRLDIIMKLIMNEIIQNPNWKNIDKIAKLHSIHDLKSTFFWIATQKVAANKVRNADYSTKEIKKLIKFSESNGLHKSCYTSSIDEELAQLPFETKLNRFHFLKFNLPNAYDSIDESQLDLDASLGFAEAFGFRNNYGLPFNPYNLSEQKMYNFVEVPLNLMDATLHKYMKIPLEKTAKEIIAFIEKNNKNSILSLLWHNPYFTDYKHEGFLNEYKKVLLYLNEIGMKSITPNEIITEFSCYE